MPDVRTEVTEIVTGLAMLGYQNIQRALEVRPRHITHVDEDVFNTLDAAWSSGQFDRDFNAAWDNGLAFARSPFGLRGRPPWTLEWKGHHKPASKAIETIPADLRVDHVYLISCKYRSEVLHNAGPVALFEHGLAPPGPIARIDWFETIAPDSFRAIWQPFFAQIGLPPTVTPSTTSTAQRELIGAAQAADPIDINAAAYQDFVKETSERSATRWRARLRSAAARTDMYWRLLRMQAAPYFVLGSRRNGSLLRYRVDTPWDLARSFKLAALDVAPGTRRQPSVDWTATLTERSDESKTHVVHGHVEIRWSHRKLRGSPEAKIYLDTPPGSVPGYDPL